VCAHSNSWQHAGFEDTEQETHTHDLGDVGNPGRADGADAKQQREEGDKPPGTHDLAYDVGGNLEDDVAARGASASVGLEGCRGRLTRRKRWRG
jgi:hypothetical protein